MTDPADVDAQTAALLDAIHRSGHADAILALLDPGDRQLVADALHRHHTRAVDTWTPELADAPHVQDGAIAYPARTDGTAPYLDYSMTTDGGGRSVELGDGDESVALEFSPGELAAMRDALRSDARHVYFPDGRYLDASSGGTLELGHIENGEAVAVALDPDEVALIADAFDQAAAGAVPVVIEPAPEPTGPPVRINGGDGFAMRVTPYADGAHLDLAFDPDDPVPAVEVLIAPADVDALAAAAAAMQQAERDARAAYDEIDRRIHRLEARREAVQNARTDGRGAELVALNEEFTDLTARGDRLFVARRERLEHLDPFDRAAFLDLDRGAYAASPRERREIRAAQRRIVYGMTDVELAEWDDRHVTAPERRRELRERPGGLDDGGFGRRTLFDRDQAEWDRITERKREIERQVNEIGAPDPTPEQQAELAAIAADLDAAYARHGALTVDADEVAGGTVATAGGTLVWRTTVSEQGEVRHQIDQRPDDAGDDWHIGRDYDVPEMTAAQIGRVVEAVRAAAAPPSRPRPPAPPAVAPPT